MTKFYALLLAFFSAAVFSQEPAGYYNSAAGLTGQALKTELSKIISAGHKDNGYNGLYNGYPTTDTDHFYENDGTVLDMYSEKPSATDPYTFTHGVKKCGNYNTEGDCYNREHIVPQSLFNSKAPMVSDIHFIRPTDGKVNGMRSNFPFGPVNTPTITTKNGSKLGPCSATGYGGTVFEPINEFKGDIARMVFYFVTRYESQLGNFSTGNMLGGSAFPGLQIWERDVLLQWAAQDPVSPSEIERNNAAYAFQKNRNPYIDHPEWVERVWGTQVIDTEAPTAPINLTVNSASTASITLNWTAATDNIGVTGYKIYVNGAYKSTSTTTTAVVTGLAQGTTYSFYVIATDAANNVSPQSNTVQGTTLTDNIAPTAPTNLSVVTVGTNSISVQWTASTDNVAVTSYDVYVNGVLTTTTDSPNANISNLAPYTQYTIYVVAKDAVNNVSPQSNSVTATTNAVGSSCGNENFENIPASASNYSTYNWTSNGIAWTSEDSRTDLTIDNRAITIRDGSLKALSVPNGIGSLTVTTQLKYNGTSGNLDILVNGAKVGTVPYSTTATTTTVSNINIAGSIELVLQNSTVPSNRIAIDNLSWTCFANLGTAETTKDSKFQVYPNPVKNSEIYVNGIEGKADVQIYSISGQLVQEFKSVNNQQKLMLKKLPKGVYLVKAGNNTAKIIVD